MNVKEEDVFLIVLEGCLNNAPSSRSATDVTLAAKDITNEIMSVVGKMSKSSGVTELKTYD